MYLLKNIGEEGIQHHLNKLEEIIRACDNYYAPGRHTAPPWETEK